MARFIEVTPNKTYKTADNAHKAVEKSYLKYRECSYIIMKDESGRYYPVFVGTASIEASAFRLFNTVN